MKKFISLLIIILLIPSYSYAYSSAEIVIESSTGRALYENNPKTILPMASTTKLMTAIIAVEYGDLNSMATISEYAASITGSRMELHKGDTLSLRSLLVGLLFVSGNDSATAIAEHISGNEIAFVDLMNNKAKQIGCENTSYKNPHGLDEDGHYTTAKDLAKVANYAIKIPEIYEILSSAKEEFMWNEKSFTMYNKNKLKSMYEYGIGGKTGYTENAGRCLVSYAEKDSMMLVCVVLNSTDTYGDTINLFKNTYDKYSMVKVKSLGEYITSIPIIDGRESIFDVYFPYDINIPLSEVEKEQINVRYLFPKRLTAPINCGDEIGRYAIMLGEERLILGIINSGVDIHKTDSIFDIAAKIIGLSF